MLLAAIASMADAAALCVEHHGSNGDLSGLAHGSGSLEQDLHPARLLRTVHRWMPGPPRPFHMGARIYT